MTNKAFASFNPMDAWGGKVVAGQAGSTAFIRDPPRIKVQIESTNGSIEEAGRLARLCYAFASKGKALDEIRKYRKCLLADFRGYLTKPKGKRKHDAKEDAKKSAKRHSGIKGKPGPSKPPPFFLSELPLPESEHEIGPEAPTEGVKRLFAMMNARETIAKRRASGLSGIQLYEGLPEELANYFKRRSCPNVRRREDRTTRDLRNFAAAEARYALCKTEAERLHLKRLFVFNFALWRFVGGTIDFARAVGFVTNWTDKEKEKVCEAVRKAFHEGRAQSLFSNAYESPNKIRVALGPNCDEAKLEGLLYNRGPKAVSNVEPTLTYFTIFGKLRLLDLVWQICPKVVEAAKSSRWQSVANVLGRIPQFGTTEKGYRVPTFFAKEITQDLLDTPVFEGGRSKVIDLRSFSPAGPGAILGLNIIYGDMEKLLQKLAIPRMRAILEAGGKYWEHGDPADLELHDIQFMLCELQKLFHDANTYNSLRNYGGAPEPCLSTTAFYAAMPDLLEDAMLLLAGSRCSEGQASPNQGFDPALEREEIMQFVSKWLGLPPLAAAVCDVTGGTIQSNDEALCHGDLVSLRASDKLPKSGAATADVDEDLKGLLSLDPGAFRGALAEVAIDGRQASRHGTAFLIQRRAGAGPLQFGDDIWLRVPSGAHLGPSGTTVGSPLSAQTSSTRYDDARLFRVGALSQQKATKGQPVGAVVASGSAVVLQSLQFQDALVSVPAAKGPCRLMSATPDLAEKSGKLIPARRQPQNFSPILLLERVPSASEKAMEQFRPILLESLAESVRSGNLVEKISQQGRTQSCSKSISELQLSNSEIIRRRLIGSL
eukprot:TRINITY_DN35526_c0_g2_i1.p1 TRINITY_DN35526_c0_g2~~TRINITY_DN35526_c0_g2_i1.p1  ORF type:complete len:911 (+),score=179.16 TRINITY_DN35526_c0_g2_i1:253-2733(+)